MALIKCPECGKEISDKSLSCPNCGCPASGFLKQNEVEKTKNENENVKLCFKCGRYIQKELKICPYCGKDPSDADSWIGGKSETKIKLKNEYPTLRLVVSVILLALSLLILYQSRLIIFFDNVAGAAGFMLAIAFIVSGVVGIVTRNSAKHQVCYFIAFMLIFLGVIAIVNTGKLYEDLKIWGYVSLIASCVFSSCGRAIKKNNK